MKIRILLLALLLSVSTVSARAASLTVGVIYGHAESEYKGVPSYMAMFGSYRGPLPIITFDSELLSLGVDGLSLHVFNNDLLTADLLVAPFGNKFDPDDSDTLQMQYLDERDMTLAAGVALGLNTPWGRLKAIYKADVLNESDSLTFSLGYSYMFMAIPRRLILIPSAEITFTNAEHNDYYYGVTLAESQRSGYMAYEIADGDYYTEIGLTAILMLTETGSLSLMANGGLVFLADSVEDSPMVQQSSVWHAMVGITYKFDLSGSSGTAGKSQPADVRTSGQPRNAAPNRSVDTLRNGQNTRNSGQQPAGRQPNAGQQSGR